jgi:predicted dinucleotide-binding enzyme
VQLASRHPESLRPLVASLGERATSGTPVEAVAFGEVVMLTVPLRAVPDLAHDLARSLVGKVVLDTGNAYEQRDGQAAREAATHAQGSAGWAAAMFPGVRWVKAFNTVNFKTLAREAHRGGEQVGIPLASDDAAAMETAARLARDAGFDPVLVGPLGRGKEFQPGAWPYNTGMSGRELRDRFAAASSAS